ncbi:MAG TPA: hypothetical protein VGH49_21040 [Xanthobacteraceae bacterium]|jgi:hypothetical protein
MSLHQWLGVGAGALLVWFIVFAFRQGMKATPDDRPDRGPSVGRRWAAPDGGTHDGS